jgi:hypothetical protein
MTSTDGSHRHLQSLSCQSVTHARSHPQTIQVLYLKMECANYATHQTATSMELTASRHAKVEAGGRTDYFDVAKNMTAHQLPIIGEPNEMVTLVKHCMTNGLFESGFDVDDSRFPGKD